MGGGGGVGRQFRKWLSGSYGVYSLNIGLSRPIVPLKIKEIYIEISGKLSKAVYDSSLVLLQGVPECSQCL